jgi:branched-chain amino acid transport system substrate-binding protein
MPRFLAQLFLVTAAVALLSSACSDGDGSSAPIEAKLGIVQSMTGPAGVYGVSVKQGIDLAVKEFNEQGQVRLSTTVLDDLSTVDGGKAAFQSLIADESIAVIVGPTLSNVALETFPIANEAAVPVVSPTTSAARITEIGEYIFRVALAEEVVVPATVQYVARETNMKRAVLILDSADAFSRSSADAMRKGMAAINGTLTAEIDVARENLAQGLAGLAGQPVDAFLITPLVEQSGVFVKAIRDAGFQQTIVGGNSFNTLSIANLAGGAIEGAYVGAAWNPDLSATTSQDFVRNYTQAYGVAPDQFAAQGHATVYVIADAIRRAGSADHAAIRDALLEIRNLDTVLGALGMSPYRSAFYNPVIQRYRDGKLVAVQ